MNALTRRIAEGWADEYDTLKPVADLHYRSLFDSIHRRGSGVSVGAKVVTDARNPLYTMTPRTDDSSVDMDPFLQQLKGLCSAHPTRAKWVFVPTHALGRTLGDRLVLEGTDWANLRFVTPLDIALRMGRSISGRARHRPFRGGAWLPSPQKIVPSPRKFTEDPLCDVRNPRNGAAIFAVPRLNLLCSRVPQRTAPQQPQVPLVTLR